MESGPPGFNVNEFQLELMNAGKGLLVFPSSTAELLDVLEKMEKRLERVLQMPSESMKYALQPVIRALIAKQLLRHPDMEVNISVACCICEVFTIMVRKTPYDDEQMKDFFELFVITFEKLSSESGGCFDKMIKVLRTLDSCKFSVKMCNLQLDGLIVRLFRQFLTVADSNSADVVIKMKNIMTMIIEKSEMLNRELVDLLVTSVRKENKIASPVCWQLGGEVLKNCATHLKPHLDEKVVKEVYSSLTETIPSTTDTSKDVLLLRKFKVALSLHLKMVQPVRPCQAAKKRGKKTPLFDDPSMPTKSVTEERAENLVGRRIKVWWSEDKSYYRGVVKSYDGSTKRHKVLYDDGEEELIDLNQERWELVEITSSLSNFEMKLMNAGRRLLPLPSSTAELLGVLRQIENFLHRVQEKPSVSMKYAMYPIIEALVAKELLRYSDMNVNIIVACCICDVLRIMDYNASYNEEQMKGFFELAVITFEKLSTASGGCYTKMLKVLKTLSGLSYSVLESDLRLNGLIVRLFKQFLTVADSNSSDVVLKMKKILTIIIEESEPLNLELVDLLVASVRKENQIISPVCWELGNKVIKKCAAKLKPFLRDKLAKEVYESLGETIPSTTNTSKVMKNTTHKRKRKCLDGIRNKNATPKRRLECLDGKKNRVNVLHIHSEDEKKHEEKTLSSDDLPMSSTSVTEVLYDDDHEEQPNLKNEQWKLIENPSATSDSAMYGDDDGDLSDIRREHLELVENVSSISDSVGPALPRCDIICIQGYNVKLEIAPILESIFKIHGDIAADCFFKTSCVRTSFLEVICGVVKRIESSDVSTIISDMEEIERQVLEAQQANINVSWLRTHLETIRKRNESMKTSTLLNTILVKRTAEADLIESCRELVAAQERFVNAERCVKVLDIVGRKLKESVKQPLIG
ncbi:phospholipase-like protein [Tanacetum coccineum]